jgi:ATP-dependent exoDNAse (exonuclease V) beta subunit
MKLKEPSNEQKIIIELIKDYNIVVNAVAGSGKTTTILHIATKYPTKKILLITYNKRLKQETRERVIFNNIKNITVHNYHSFCVQEYKMEGYTDDIILDVIINKIERKFIYDIIIIDEIQDMNNIYYELIYKIIKQNKNDFRICLLGDINQNIYNFNNADSRYLIYSELIFNLNNNEWKRLTLNETFRLTPEIVDFINNCVLKEKRIISKKINIENIENIKPRYIFCNSYDDRILYEIIHYYLKILNFDNNNYEFQDIFILAPSVKSDKTPIKSLANKLSIFHNIPIYIPNSDDEILDDDIIKNKILFSSYHQAKGLERKIVIIYSFDSSYFEYYNKNADKSKCTNEIYVALTRAKERLTVIHDYKYNFLNFLDIDNIEKYCYNDNIKMIRCFDRNNKIFNFQFDIMEYNKKNIFNIDNKTNKRIIENIIIDIINNNKINNIVSVTNFIKHIPYNIISETLKYIEIIDMNKNDIFDTDSSDSDKYNIEIDTKIKQDILYENVSDITGIAIPIYFEYIKTKKITILEILDNEYKSNKLEREINDIRNKIDNMNILKIANIYNAITNELYFKIHQIKEYKWLSKNMLELAIKRLEKNIKNNPKFEIKFIKEINFHNIENLFLKGYIDCIDDENVWELKFIKKITNTHILQLALYMYMYKINNDNNKRFFLLNIYDGTKIEIKSDIDKLQKIIFIIYNYKYKFNNNITDDEFFNNIDIIKNKYL